MNIFWMISLIVLCPPSPPPVVTNQPASMYEAPSAEQTLSDCRAELAWSDVLIAHQQWVIEIQQAKIDTMTRALLAINDHAAQAKDFEPEPDGPHTAWAWAHYATREHIRLLRILGDIADDLRAAATNLEALSNSPTQAGSGLRPEATARHAPVPPGHGK